MDPFIPGIKENNLYPEVEEFTIFQRFGLSIHFQLQLAQKTFLSVIHKREDKSTKTELTQRLYFIIYEKRTNICSNSDRLKAQVLTTANASK